MKQKNRMLSGFTMLCLLLLAGCARSSPVTKPTVKVTPVPTEPVIAAKDCLLSESDLALTDVVSRELLPDYPSLAAAGAKITMESCDGMWESWYSAELNGIVYFFPDYALSEYDNPITFAAIGADAALSGGAAIGDTEDALLALYPQLVKTELSSAEADSDFSNVYRPSVSFRPDQFPAGFLAQYDYGYYALIDTGESDCLPVCAVFLIKDGRIAAITAILPTAG